MADFRKPVFVLDSDDEDTFQITNSVNEKGQNIDECCKNAIEKENGNEAEQWAEGDGALDNDTSISKQIVPSMERVKIDGTKPKIDPSYQPKKLKKFLSESSYESFESELWAKVLVLYTGGTVGMKSVGGVYSPVPNFLVPELRKLPMFHDPNFKLSCLENISENYDLQSLHPLVMPLSTEGKRVIYTIFEYEPLLDSCNMTMDDWARIARDIKKNYKLFDGFVILHGTDTMGYTAAALSFMLENLGKPVILTGSQIPIFETRSDGRDNFLGALIIAGHYCIPEVTLFFRNKLYRGNRTTKVDSSSFEAFDSPNMPPLVTMEIGITVDWHSIFRPSVIRKFDIATDLCPHVGLLRLFPSISVDTVRQFLHPPMQGAVLQSYGAGNGPSSRTDLLQVFKEASDRGVIIINITQCNRGHVTAAYATGKALTDAGILAGGDLIPEAALTKLSYVLAKQIPHKEKIKLMTKNLRGEMAVIIKEDMTVQDFALMGKVAEAIGMNSTQEIVTLRDAIYPSLACFAAKNADMSTLEKIRLTGGNLLQADYDGRTALHIAACEGHFHIAQYLLQHGARIHSRDRYGNTPLVDAIRFHQKDIIRLIMQCGGHLTTPPYKLGSELGRAAAEDNLEMLQCYKMAGVNLNQGDVSGRTALHVAAAKGREKICSFLLENEASVTVTDGWGKRPIDEANHFNHSNIVTLLNRYDQN